MALLHWTLFFQCMNAAAPRDRGLRLIAVFKLLKAASLFAAGFGVLRLLDPGTAERVTGWIVAISGGHVPRLLARALAFVTGQRPDHLRIAGLAFIAYGALFAVEGVGLWLRRRWAEHLTVFATGSLIPFEVYELVRRITPLRVLAVLLNVAVVAYLAYRLATATSPARVAASS